MADILTNVLNEKITINELKKWLTAENPKETICSDIEQNGCTRTEFISYFLNYLREQCKSVLPEIKDTQEKPAKKSAEIPNPESPRTKLLAANNSKMPSKCTVDKEGHVDWKTLNSRQQNFQPRAISLNSSSPQNLSPISKMPISKKSPISPINFPPLPNHHDVNSQLATNVMRKIPTTIVQQSCQNAGNSVVQSNADTSNFSSDRSPINRNFPDVSGEGKFAALNHRLMGKMENLDLSENDSSNCSFEANSSWKFEDSRKNGSFLVNSSLAPCSPISPIYAKNTSILCPRKIDKSQNDHHDSSRNSDNNSSATSTPKSGQKTMRTGSVCQSVCLGDFMNSDGKGTKKMSKRQMKTQLWRESQEKKKSTNETDSSIGQNTKETGIKINENKSKRRIKPTRLNVSGDKETRGPEIFGVISRPNTANPKFVGAPSSDKSQEELSFEVERGLMKLERQRQPKSEIPSEISNIEGKLTNIKTKQDATIVPRLDEVTNIRKIEILTLIYGSIMDHNLMINPMTEFYFLITLLTTQYRELSDGKLTEKNGPDEIGEISKILNDDLGCSELADISTEINNEDSVESFNADETRENEDFSVEKIQKNFETFFDTPHNCVYFAVTVIFNQRYFLNILDRATLKLLCENQQIATFRPELQIYLNELYGVKCTQTNRVKSTESGNSQTNVCFQVDTDNRETFPSTAAFALFRKQRDLFYDILKDWEDNHLQPDWSFQRALKNKINSLLTLHTDAVNYCHFAKLFTSQLLVSSGQSGKTEDPMNDESLSFLKSLKHLNPEKLIQLKGRLVTPLTSMGPVPQPVFPGVQEFYKEFILNASNWKFYVILENTFISEIMELNEAQFAQSEIEATETTVDESTKQNFLTCVSSLRLLAKFTSFTLTLPFKSAAESPEWLLSQIHLRGRVMPSLDLQNCLIDAVKNRRLSLTVPWVVQYMGMLDTVTLRLPYYANISEFLYCIYRKSNNNEKSSQTSMLMAFTIGWFFELSNFPREIYQNWQMNYDEEKFRNVDFSNYRQRIANIASNDVGKSSNEKFLEYNSRLDQLDIIDDRAFYECCPFLREFKILLISGNATLGSNNANRHITPVSSQLSQPNFRVKTKNLQAQLEEAFFHGQPSSIRKTVDFVSERVASSCVKYICNSIIPSSRQRNMKDFIKSKNGKIDLIQREEDPEDKAQTSPNDSPSKSGKKAQNALIERQMQNLATTIKDDVKRECAKIISEMCETRTIKSIESLLADDALPSVKESCISIAIRNAIERVEQWIDSHIIESLFLKNMATELKKLLKDVDEKNLANKENCHNAKVPSPTEVIEMLRNSMWELLEKKGSWTELSVNSVDKTLKCLHQTLTERADLIEYAEKNLYTMSVEYSLLLMTHRRGLFTPEIQSKFVKIWKMNNSRASDKEGLFVRIISSRNIRLLTSKSDPTVMKIFGRLLRGLLKEGLLNMEALSEQCVALFRQEWPEAILKQLSQCLRDVVADCKCTGHDAEGIKYLLEWIATTCDQMEICDYD